MVMAEEEGRVGEARGAESEASAAPERTRVTMTMTRLLMIRLKVLSNGEMDEKAHSRMPECPDLEVTLGHWMILRCITFPNLSAEKSIIETQFHIFSKPLGHSERVYPFTRTQTPLQYRLPRLQ